uniref:Uncharacterized protein n=1 Tax=Magallana gigas TaxID=29159 RepID=A0A8W8MK44_MAGGI
MGIVTALVTESIQSGKVQSPASYSTCFTVLGWKKFMDGHFVHRGDLYIPRAPQPLLLASEVCQHHSVPDSIPTQHTGPPTLHRITILLRCLVLVSRNVTHTLNCPVQWTTILVLVKIYKLLINELSNQIEANMWYDVDKEEEEDPDFSKDPTYQID